MLFTNHIHEVERITVQAAKDPHQAVERSTIQLLNIYHRSFNYWSRETSAAANPPY